MTVEDLLEHARMLVLPGFTRFDEVVERLAELAADEQDEEGSGPVTDEAVAALVRQVWDAREAEQRDWSPVTDADRVGAAFAALESHGVVARMNFTCCQNCGCAEIRHEAVAHGPTRGFVFFHEQDAERLADEPATLFLSYGAFGATDRAAFETASLEIGRRIVAAVQAVGLAPDRDGTLDRRIAITGLLWRRRLPR